MRHWRPSWSTHLPMCLRRISMPRSATQKIVENGYAYEDPSPGNGKMNVWFDTRAFDGGKKSGEAEAHSYAKLAPWSKGDTSLLEEGEGESRVQAYPALLLTCTFQALFRPEPPLWQASAARPTLRCGRRRSPASRHGIRRGVPAGQAGTLSAV
jgi:hypothetical protein